MPETLGDHLRRKRLDLVFTNVQEAQILGVAYQTVERWEDDRRPIAPRMRPRIIAFPGYDPDAVNAGQADD